MLFRSRAIGYGNNYLGLKAYQGLPALALTYQWIKLEVIDVADGTFGTTHSNIGTFSVRLTALSFGNSTMTSNISTAVPDAGSDLSLTGQISAVQFGHAKSNDGVTIKWERISSVVSGRKYWGASGTGTVP